MSSVVNKTRNLLLFLTVVLAGCGGAEEAFPPRSEEPAPPVVESPAPKSDSKAEAVETFIPNRLKIPVIDVNAKIEVVGKDDKGRMDVPKQTDQVGWYQYGAKAPTLAQRLTLITCVGTFTQSKGYDQRLVVTAEQEK